MHNKSVLTFTILLSKIIKLMKLLELNVFWVEEFSQIVNGKIRMGVGLKAAARIVSRY